MSSETNEQQQTADISNLQESFQQQQEKISALKELVRKSGAAHGSSKSAAQETVKIIAERLKISKAKSKQGLNVSTYTKDESAREAQQSTQTSALAEESPLPSWTSTSNVSPSKSFAPVAAFSTPGNEKILLMHQQLEQNRLRLEQKNSSKQHLEQLVSQLKEKFDSTQQSLKDTSDLGKSMSDLSSVMHAPVGRERHKSVTDLSAQHFSLEKERIKFLENRCRLLEKQLEKHTQQKTDRKSTHLESRIVELEKCLAAKEADHAKEIGDLKGKKHETGELEHNEKTRLNSDIIRLSTENERLIAQIAELNKQYDNSRVNLEETNNRLRLEVEELQSRLDSYSHNEDSEATHLKSENAQLRQQVDTLAGQLESVNVDSMEIVDSKSEIERLRSVVAEQLGRINELNETCDVLETTRCDLAAKIIQLEETIAKLQDRRGQVAEKCENPMDTPENSGEHAKESKTDSLVKAEMAKQIQELKDEIEESLALNRILQQQLEDSAKLQVNDQSIADKIAALEATIESQREDLQTAHERLKKTEDELMEKTIELNVLSVNFKVLEEKLEQSSKAKPLFATASMGSDDSSNALLVQEIQQLKQKLDESNKTMIKLKLKCKQSEKQIEKLKKGSDLHAEVVQLAKDKESLQQKITELEDEKGQWQLMHMEASDECKHEAVLSNYQEKVDSLTQELREKQQECDRMRKSEETRVTSELKEIQLEETAKELIAKVNSLQNELDECQKALHEANESVATLRQQKEGLDKKLEHYLNENIELLDKVEKLSKSSSSAESIEIVERLTLQEKQELDEFNKRLEAGETSEETPPHKDAVNELTQTEMNPELTESLNKLREESSELMSKIELFTTERREVLEKMEHLSSENHALQQQIASLTQEKVHLQQNLDESAKKQNELLCDLEAANKEKNLLAVQIAETRSNRNQLSQELTSLQQSSEVVAALDNGETLFDKCEKSLSKLNYELEAYRKANDKKAKFNVSKKLAKEAENAYSQLSELLHKVKEASSAVETVTVVETVVAVTAPNGKALAEYEQLTAQNRELKATISELRRLLDETREEAEDRRDASAGEQQRAIRTDSESAHKLMEAQQQNAVHEEKLIVLQQRVEELTRELCDARNSLGEKMESISRLSDEVKSLKKLSDDFDRLIDDKEMDHEKNVAQLTRLRKELESKCDTYEQEIEILQTLVAEQKQQLIETFKEHEYEMNEKLLALQEQEQQSRTLRQEVAELKEAAALAGSELTQSLQKECDHLKEALKINKNLVQQQVEELANKQETIDALNQQIIDLYRSMEENATRIIEKDDEIAYVQEILDNNKEHVLRLEGQLKDIEIKHQQLQAAYDLKEDQLRGVESTNKGLLQSNQDLENRNKEQLDKLKKYAANLKKKALQCQEYQSKLKELELQTVGAKRIDELQTFNSELQSNLDETRKELAHKTSALLALEGEVNELRIIADQKESSNQKLQSDLLAVRQELHLYADYQRTAQEAQEELLLLREQLREQKQQTEELRQSGVSEGKSLQSELQAARSTTASLTAQLTPQTHDTPGGGDSWSVSQLKKEISTLQDQLALKTHEIEQLSQCTEGESSIKKADFKNMTMVLSDKDIKLQQAELKVRELEAQLSTLQNSIHLESDSLVRTTEDETAALKVRVQELTEDLRAKSIKFEKSKAVIKDRNGQIHRLQAQVKDLQEKLASLPEEEALSSRADLVSSVDQETEAQLKAAQAELKELNLKYASEKSQFQATIARLETLHAGIQAKLQEDMSYTEALEQENSRFKDKICRLEDCVASFEERRASMERKVNIMDAQLQSRSEEHAKTEDELIYRLNMLSEHDEVIARRLIESQSDKEEIEENFEKLQTEHNNLQAKYTKLEREFSEFKTETSDDFENELMNVREQLQKAKSDADRLKAVLEAKVAAKATELDELECEMTDQMEKMNAEKRDLSEQIERLTDDCSSHQNDILRLQEAVNTLEQAKAELERELSWLRMQTESTQQDLYELQELRTQSLQDKTELDNLRHQMESLSASHEGELQALRTQIADLDSLRMQVGQNQTDDQVFIETENKRLTDLLAEKEAVIENYQRQNLQLQMAAATASSVTANQADPFAVAFGLPPQSGSMLSGGPLSESSEVERLNHELSEKNSTIVRLQQDLSNLQAEFSSLLDSNQEMQRQLGEHDQETVSRLTLQGAASSLTASQPSDVIPAPPMFFGSESSTRSPFDDIHVLSSHGISSAAGTPTSSEQPTIEDLQRNVSDLEKHAQDLEHKLVARNQREAEYDERLRDLESRLHEREKVLQQVTSELETLRGEHAMTVGAQNELAVLHTQLGDLQMHIQMLEQSLRQRDQELENLRRENAKLVDEEYLRKTVKSVESQIVTDASIQPTLDMFFGNAGTQDCEPFIVPETSQEPVVEEIIVPKRTYDCHPEERKAVSANISDVGLDMGDDWGESWGNSEAAAEAEHFAKVSESKSGAQTSLVPKEQLLEMQMQEMTERLQELQLALDRSEEQKKELHVKSGKLMKKLREYKTKVEELQASTQPTVSQKTSAGDASSLFGDLDAAIQEELKLRIKSLESQLEDQVKLQENFAAEKEKLLRRVDVLTAASDRMTEMKERQDMELHMYQARIRELQQKLQSLDDWGTEDTETPNLSKVPLGSEAVPTQLASSADSSELQSKLDELNSEVQDLNADRAELQALLEEEKMNSQRAEQMLETLRLQLRSLEESEETAKIEVRNLRESQDQLLTANNKLMEDLKSEESALSQARANELRLQDELANLQAEVENLRETLGNTRQSLIDLESELSALKQQKERQLDAALSSSETQAKSDDMEETLAQKRLLEEQVIQLSQTAEKNRQMAEDNSRQLQVLDNRLRSLQTENEHLKQVAAGTAVDDISSQLQEKECEIMHLKQRISDLMNEDQTEKLVLEILTKNQEIHMLKMQVKALEDDKQELENNLSLQLTTEMHASKSTDQDSVESNKTKVLETQVADLLAEKKQMEEELQVLNNHVLESLHWEDKMKELTLQLDAKNIEIMELRKTVEASKHQGTEMNAPQQSAALDYAALNSQWEGVVDQRCGEIAKMWQEHLTKRELEFKAQEEQLLEKIRFLRSNQQVNLADNTMQRATLAETSSSTPLSESTSASGSGSTSAEQSQQGTPFRARADDDDVNAAAIVEKMQAALESQEVEIVTLKEQLAIRSAEYARLAAQYDPFKLQSTSSHVGVVESKKQHSGGNTDSMVPKSELDLALYMLHQRDMRCEEMTLELVSLLEERDTLQLKLSNTLRQVEAIRAQGIGEASAGSTTTLTSGTDVDGHTSGASSTAGIVDEELNQKLSQLQSVNHSKDKLIKEEREQRSRQMEKLQQDVAKIPPAAVSEIVGTDLSQTNQSPSTVLLNWLWGNKGGSGGSSQADF